MKWSHRNWWWLEIGRNNHYIHWWAERKLELLANREWNCRVISKVSMWEKAWDPWLYPAKNSTVALAYRERAVVQLINWGHPSGGDIWNFESKVCNWRTESQIWTLWRVTWQEGKKQQETGWEIPGWYTGREAVGRRYFQISSRWWGVDSVILSEHRSRLHRSRSAR